ncbi:hypothetical protein [Oharaeibacter diazotrophicus]|uniref:DUF1918 domain-containing protein n=1 Tax=Oharaeibacter diazotrophicus TaxID=1920512 RepID=A0A4R6RDH1_9HYPH|nr:hypothetical protein [Oharaeibacter diazotrophicus]TDP84230.1 hypothetical protein EDD54_2835 [Oharaeibacter diazotrophicus]BBE73268.1 hypothetical protein OHA_1_02877 [Pleomorphomonas sp. SM30]GLS75058.1 hypothetical protein GCM10007904_03930 [Oharaeibacter diazotrophicus]
MSTTSAPFTVGQSVRILHGPHRLESSPDVYTIVRYDASDGPERSYVIESDRDYRRRREVHDRLLPVDSASDSPANPSRLPEPR